MTWLLNALVGVPRALELPGVDDLSGVVGNVSPFGELLVIGGLDQLFEVGHELIELLDGFRPLLAVELVEDLGVIAAEAVILDAAQVQILQLALQFKWGFSVRTGRGRRRTHFGWAARLLCSKHLGAGKVIGTGRNESELKELLSLGADLVIPFRLATENPAGAKDYANRLIAEFAHGINVVIDYLWGESAKTVIVAIAKAVEDGHPVRFVHTGGASREENIELPGAALRSSAIQLMGSGAKSVPFPKLLEAVRNVFDVAASTKLQIVTKIVPLSAIEQTWHAPGKPRIVFTTK